MGPGDVFWRNESQILFNTLFPIVSKTASEAAISGLGMLEVDLGISFDLVNERAVQWARSYTYELITQINETSRTLVGNAVSEWTQSGAPLEDLIRELEPTFGAVRAEAIAVTETTRIYAEGNLIGWISSGVVDQIKWYTVYDEDVCTVCEPLNGETTDLFDRRFPGGVSNPPAHVRCRCWIMPIVNKAKLLRAFLNREDVLTWRTSKSLSRGLKNLLRNLNVLARNLSLN